MVMFSHTIFSLSFALIAMLLAFDGHIRYDVFIWIMVCFLGARTGANAINRVIDAKFDALNHRTAGRQIPKGEIKAQEVILFTGTCFAIMVFGAYKLNTICLLLSPFALFFLILYSYTKRFTFLCHLVLGVTSAMAPVGAWLAVTGSITIIPLVIGAANTLWVAGFDILYGAQDYAFDKEQGLHSIPVRFGVKNALLIAKAFHTCSWCLLFILGMLSANLSTLYFVGLGIIALLFIAQHVMVSENNLSLVKIASYSVNQCISIVFLTTGLLDVLLF